MTKSHVGMGEYECPVCHKRHGQLVLLDTRLRNKLEPNNFLGYELCPEHKEQAKEYLAMVEVTAPVGEPSAAFTGQLCWVRREILPQLFPEMPDKVRAGDYVLVPPRVIAQLTAMAAQAEQDAQTGHQVPDTPQ